jgi:hypothetical protein
MRVLYLWNRLFVLLTFKTFIKGICSSNLGQDMGYLTEVPLDKCQVRTFIMP